MLQHFVILLNHVYDEEIFHAHDSVFACSAFNFDDIGSTTKFECNTDSL